MENGNNGTMMGKKDVKNYKLISSKINMMASTENSMRMGKNQFLGLMLMDWNMGSIRNGMRTGKKH